MFSDRRDYLMDAIERMVQGMLEQLRRAVGADTQQVEALERECERAMEDEFAELHRRVSALTSRSAGETVRPVSKLRAYAMVLSVRALAQATRTDLDADPELGRQSAMRGLELLLEAVLATEPTPMDRQLAPALFALIDPEALSPRYLQALVDLGASPP
jgi:hypothetical protein